jgi:TolB-like protein
MKYFCYILMGLVCLVGACAHRNQSILSERRASSKELDRQIDTLTEQIINSLTAQKINKIAVIEFSNLEGKVSDLGRYLAEELTTRLFRTGRFQIVERRLMNKMIEEQKLSISGLIDENTASRVGRVLGVDALATGTIADLNTSVKINARMIATETGSVFSVACVKVPMNKEMETLLGKKTGVAESSDAARFDGTWDVILDCFPQDKTLGYTYKIVSYVKDGVFHGQYGMDSIAPCLALDGKISPDGSAVILASGLAGDPKYNNYNYRKGAPYSYHIDATFSASRGTGSRLGQRICNVTFIKR